MDQPWQSEIIALIERARATAYREGYADALRKVMDAAAQEPMEVGAPKAPSASTTRSRPPTERAGRGARDDLVADTICGHGSGMRGNEVEELLASRGHRVARSSLNVILRRLVEHGRVRQEGRLYLPPMESSTSPAVRLWDETPAGDVESSDKDGNDAAA